MSDSLSKEHLYEKVDHLNGNEQRKVKSKVVSKSNKRDFEFIVNYHEFLHKLNYSISTIRPHLGRTKYFVSYYAESTKINVQSLVDLQDLTMNEVGLYEDYLMGRVNRKEIKAETAYSCIKNLRLFIEFLKNEGIIKFRYKIPKRFIASPTRLNSYIPSELLSELIRIAKMDQSGSKYRSLAIVSILIDTGCRPIELSNLKIHDVRLHEKTITLHSVKSGKYILKLNDFVIGVLKKYLRIRNGISTEGDHLFCKNNGDLLEPANISSIIYNLNIKAFGYTRVNARSIRHTHITNAIDNGNDLEEVSRAVGHIRKDSTVYYLERSEKRLLANTLGFNPLQNILEEK